ncbi:hypothetical protein H0H81_007131 [Sphagnurus paluster]|uniref:Uncharacterized protein n=1 Tax=Sphagnurus paluster TaxID=117069 RepID=A0A9P7FXL3_9AGAR|nr:hypothetical protein H0H81_007131 [Sphagnurus paluster]
MQTTTVAAQASVPRKDMSVVTAFPNHVVQFIRLLGGTLALAVNSTVINNSLTTAMKSISLPPSLITRIVDNPSSLASPATIGLSPSSAAYILEFGYTKGFKVVFILNAALLAVATVASILMIGHKELTREDDDTLRQSAQEEQEKQDRKPHTITDIELGSVGKSPGAKELQRC